MTRQDMPRIFQLLDGIENPDAATSYFRRFEISIAEPLKRKHWLDIETQLCKLDDHSWNLLRAKSLPRFQHKQKTRTWEQAFDTLNEAKAYSFLIESHCLNVRFIAENLVKGQRSPDLSGLSGNQRILCEVKTINPSDTEMVRRMNGGVRTTTPALPPGFFRKLESQIKSARGQLDSHSTDSGTRKIVYFIINFDDQVSEYLSDYILQLKTFCLLASHLGLELVIDVKPQFYSCIPEPTPSEIYVKSETGVWSRFRLP